MRKLITTITILLFALVSNAQINKIETSNLDVDGKVTEENYLFFYSDKYLTFGKESEDTEDYTFVKFTSKSDTELVGVDYFLFTTDLGYSVFIRKDNSQVLFIGENTFIFY